MENANDAKAPKKPKLALVNEEEGSDQTPLFILHSLSVSSPLRKKLNITITASSLVLSNPTTGATESSIPLSTLSRAFFVSNIGKNRNKPHWTILLLSNDTWDKNDVSSQMQVAFAVDHVPSNAKDLFTTTTYPPGEPIPFDKGTRTFPHLKAFLACLPENIPLIIASASSTTEESERSYVPTFRSSLGQPYVEAYRNAKEGSLYLLNTGILWAESKPCEFFALEDIAPDDDEHGSGVRTLSVTGRTFSIFIRRKSVMEKSTTGEDDEGSGEEVELVGEETEFAMVDGKEQDNVAQWIRAYKRSFGKKREDGGLSSRNVIANSNIRDKGKGKASAEEVQAQQQEDLAGDLDSEEDDLSFVFESDTDGGEPTSDSSDEDEGGDGGGSGGGGSDGSDGSGSEGEGEEDEDEEEGGDERNSDDDDGADSGEEEELDPKHHPLLRPGAMPRMSKAAMEMSIKMMTQDIVGEVDEDEEDELEDD